MTEFKTRSGRCACGAVTFEASVPDEYHACHCAMCRRWAGGVFMSVPGRKVEFAAPENLNRWQSSDHAERASCRYCGSAIFWRALGDETHMLNVGAFDDQSGLTFAGEVFVDEQPDHYRFEGESGRERLTGQECIEKYMPPTTSDEGSEP